MEACSVLYRNGFACTQSLLIGMVNIGQWQVKLCNIAIIFVCKAFIVTYEGHDIVDQEI